MKLWRALWLGIKAAFLPRTKSCANCSYMREWGCSASCGNDAGVVVVPQNRRQRRLEMNLVNESVLPPNELDDRDERIEVRDALEACVIDMCTYCRAEARALGLPPCLDGCETQKMARKALSRPVRNCDRFGDELDAQLAFLNEEWLISVSRETMLERDKFENWTCYMRSCYARWLMAPADHKEEKQ